MYSAVVTGASSGIGLEISKYLSESGFMVYGVGRNFRYSYEHKNFIKKELDVMKINLLKDLAEEAGNVKILVNCAGTGYFSPHEELNIQKIHEMTTVNLEVPMILSQLLLRKIKANKGYIINLASVTAKKSNPHGCAYGALKAGLANFSRSLFEENRKYGLKVCTIFPDIVKTDFFRNADFKNDDDIEAYTEAKEIADAVKLVIESRSPVTEIVIKAQKHKIMKKRKGTEK